MGQQQLLLLVLGIVIVGIAVVAGIQAFSEGKAKAEQDAAVSDAMRVISDVQAWKLKPGAFGGGADLSSDTDFTGVSLEAMGYPVNGSGQYVTTNGCFTVAGSTSQATIVAYSDDACSTEIATVAITGTTPTSIGWTYKTSGSSST